MYFLVFTEYPEELMNLKMGTNQLLQLLYSAKVLSYVAIYLPIDRASRYLHFF